MANLLSNAIVTGIVFIILGLIMSMIFKNLKPKLGEDCDKWNEHHVMEISLFFSGFVFRYLLENKTIASMIL
jgi:hypothetical protein